MLLLCNEVLFDKMGYKKSLSEILGSAVIGVGIGLGSLLYSGNSNADESKCLPIISRYEDVIKAIGAEGDEYIVNTSFDDGRKSEIIFDKNYNTLSAEGFKRISAMSTKGGVNVGTFKDEKTGGIYIYSVTHGSKHVGASTRVCRLNDYFRYENGYMVSDGLNSLFNVSEEGKLSKADDPTNEKTGTDLIKKKELIDRYDLQRVFVNNNKYNFGKREEIKTASVEVDGIKQPKEVKKNGNGKKKDNGKKEKNKDEQYKATNTPSLANKEDFDLSRLNEPGAINRQNKRIVPINGLAKVLDAGYDAGLQGNILDVGYFEPVKVAERNYSTPQGEINTPPVLDEEEAPGCSLTNFLRGLFGSKEDVIVVESQDVGIAESKDAGLADTGLDAGVKPSLRASECKIFGLAEYFTAKRDHIINEMYKGDKVLKYFKGDFAFSGVIKNGRFTKINVSSNKTTLEKGKKIKLEKILSQLQNLPAPEKNKDCIFDEIILRF